MNAQNSKERVSVVKMEQLVSTLMEDISVNVQQTTTEFTVMRDTMTACLHLMKNSAGTELVLINREYFLDNRSILAFVMLVGLEVIQVLPVLLTSMNALLLPSLQSVQQALSFSASTFLVASFVETVLTASREMDSTVMTSMNAA
jgi:hypothetical protein